MQQWIVQLVDDCFVELGVGALGLEFHRLRQLARQIVHQPAEAVEGALEREHAHAHGVVAQARGQPFHFFGHDAQFAGFRAGRQFAEPRLHHHQLADEIDQPVHPLDPYAQADLVAADRPGIAPLVDGALRPGLLEKVPRDHRNDVRSFRLDTRFT